MRTFTVHDISASYDEPAGTTFDVVMVEDDGQAFYSDELFCSRTDAEEACAVYAERADDYGWEPLTPESRAVRGMPAA